MTIFKHKITGKLYTITERLKGGCMCGKCLPRYEATSYPKNAVPHIITNLKSLDQFVVYSQNDDLIQEILETGEFDGTKTRNWEN